MTKLSPAELEALRREHSIVRLVTAWGVRLRPQRGKWSHIGPCPFHSGDLQARDSTRFECNDEAWVCVACGGGDVFDLLARREGLDAARDFRKIVDMLTGGAGVKTLSAEEHRALEDAAAERAAAVETEQNVYRDRQRAGAYDDYYKFGLRLAHPRAQAARDYLACRIGPGDYSTLLLRCDPAARFYMPDKPRARIIHTGPALLGAITRPDGKFGGVHKTFVAPELADPAIASSSEVRDAIAKRKFKASIVDPQTGAAQDAKKTRGSMRGGHVDLTGIKDPRELVLGEGIEKVLAVRAAYREGGRDVSRIAFWSAMNLDNLGGKHAEAVPHPSLKTPTGRVQRVPGPTPDMTAPAIAIPDSVERLVLLGDSTSDRFSTQCVLARAAVRYARQVRQIVCAWSPDGKDFDDLLREAA